MSLGHANWLKPERLQQTKARTAQVILRAPFLYGDRSNSPKPGIQGLVDAGQIRAMRRAVRNGIAEGAITLQHGREELAELKNGAEIINAGPLRDVGVYFPEKGCWQRVSVEAVDRHKKNKAARKARKAARAHKKSRR